MSVHYTKSRRMPLARSFECSFEHPTPPELEDLRSMAPVNLAPARRPKRVGGRDEGPAVLTRLFAPIGARQMHCQLSAVFASRPERGVSFRRPAADGITA